MCGINLLFEDKTDTVDLKFSIELMNKTIRHRGFQINSRSEVCRKEGFALGHVRLPIQGLDDKFDQPYRKGDWLFLFAGEIFNYKEIIPFAESDIEVLAELWVRKGIKCFEMFDGFWSMIAYNARTMEFHIVTDFLAKKPLYQDRETLAVSSEIKALLPHIKLPVEKDELYYSSVAKWGYHIGDRTPYERIRKIPPCTYQIIQISYRPPTYKKAVLQKEFTYTSLKPKPGALYIDLEQAVRRRLVADRPVSLVLSGGLDSTIIYELIKKVRPGEPLTVYHFTDNGEEEFLNCLEFPSWVTVKKVRMTDRRINIREILWANEGPVDLGSMIPQYLMAQAIKEDGSNISITGDGADELFGGYRRYTEYDAQYSDIFEELVYYHLPRLDKMGMAHTVEFRSPFLSRRIIENAMSWPYSMRRDKNGLKEVFCGLVPKEILQRKKEPLKIKEVRETPAVWRQQLIKQHKELI